MQGAQQAMFPGQEGAAHAAAQMPLSMPPEGEAMFNTNSVSSKSPEQLAGFPPMSKKVTSVAVSPHSTAPYNCFVMTDQVASVCNCSLLQGTGWPCPTSLFFMKVPVIKCLSLLVCPI